MFLKRMQALGFKSFADKITIPFDKGITGIVGPNGSGKSNVIDAVRWVMGEQNAKNLRGKVATDIIFSGSANRKPLAIAEVTLTFDNTDDSSFCPPEYRHEPEISLTRRLYADGQREYLINRKPCRLKDILNFFATTGLGGRSYSMIQQGQVDRILNAKPEDVRVIIEEAAGTLVYKNRRDEALKKLGNTRENLSRIEDIVAELERQQSSLKSQMEKARTWRELSQNLTEQETKLFAHNFHFYNDQLQVFEADLKTYTDQEVAIMAETATREARQSELQSALDAADPGLEGLRENVSTIREQLARAENIISSTDAKIDGHKKRLDDLGVEIESDSENLAAFEAQVRNAEEELSTAQIKAQELRDLIESFQEQVDAVDEESMVFQQRIEDFEDELKTAERMLETNTMRCEAINREREKLVQDVTLWDERIQLLDEDIVDIKKSLAVVEDKAAQVQEGLSGELNLKEELDRNVRERQDKLAELHIQRDELKEKYFDSRARLSSLQDLIAQSSDVSTSLVKLREEHGDLSALRVGLLTDYISFNDDASGLSKHLSGCFERWSERLVCNDVEQLNELLRACHKAGVGGFPVSIAGGHSMSAIKAWAERVDAEPIKNYLKITKINADVDTLLERLFVIQSLTISNDEIKDLPRGALVFTSQGLCINSESEFVVGASGDAAQGILSRKTDAETLAVTLKKLEGELASCQSDVDSLTLKQTVDKTKLRELEQKLQGQNKEALEAMAELQSSKQLLSHKIELKNNAVNQKQQLEAYDKKLVDELGEQGQARLSYDEEQERIKGELEAIREDADSVEEKRTEVFRLHESRKVELAKYETRAQSLEQSFNQANSQLQRLQGGLSRRYDEKSRIEQEIELIREECKRSNDEMEYLLVRREALEKELTEKREENAEILDNLRTVDSELKKLRDTYNKLEKSASQKKVDMERLRLAVESICQQAMEKYHLNIAEAPFTADPDFDEKRTSKEVGRLRNKIENLGAINMMAIEEYDELMKRIDFITAQREEVFNSINLLEDALEEIEETTKNRFAETFAKVDAEFQNLFPILFPTGEGRLEMSTPEDPLNSGVEIMTRLPGKKAQRMTLLSGGEKALTAISLIFALLKTKPTPFCFLDEVDAPLDEANVGRYNRVLEALSDRFQFIVITHNRRTMEVLDTLFGVTMQEPGVSKIVGVDMKKDIPEHLKKAFKTAEGDERPGATAH